MCKKVNYILGLSGRVFFGGQYNADTVPMMGADKLGAGTILFKKLRRKIGWHVEIMREKYLYGGGNIFQTVYFELSGLLGEL